ncbi:MAG: hypothetical protein HRT95_17275 [Moritella sp.]|uniref:hypothetical protein n=1 Tax=Moritella sp. TaxID=78556 RepID=UPI001D437111|nr:hypothetical protein [Moritella sp.]NQZ51856.1 hypothetical protein [Moritella sp.]
MEDWKFYVILIGVVAALVGIYFREALKQAHIQKNASRRLIAYLNFWNKNILDWDVFSIVYVGEQWRDEILEACSKSGNTETILAIDEVYENKLKKLRDAIKNKDPNLKFDIQELSEKIKKLTPLFMGQFLDAQKVSKQNIIEGKTFISDEEAAALGVDVANRAIHIKLRLVSLIDNGTILLIHLSENREQLDISDYSDEIYQCVRVGVLMYQDFKPLKEQAEFVNTQSIFKLTLKNMVGGL